MVVCGGWLPWDRSTERKWTAAATPWHCHKTLQTIREGNSALAPPSCSRNVFTLKSYGIDYIHSGALRRTLGEVDTIEQIQTVRGFVEVFPGGANGGGGVHGAGNGLFPYGIVARGSAARVTHGCASRWRVEWPGRLCLQKHRDRRINLRYKHR